MLTIIIVHLHMHTDNNGDLRLAQGSSTSSSFTAGRLEVFINGEWGTICGDGFGLAEGNVACQQLGFSRASETGINLGYNICVYNSVCL